MIYTVTFNPALDYVMDVNGVIKNETNRSVNEEIHFGGKGINVSFVLGELGRQSVALGFIGGFTGEKLRYEIRECGISEDLTVLKSGMTRINVKLRENGITEVNANGPAVCEEDISALLEKLSRISPEDTVVVSGSASKGSPADIYERVVGAIKEKGAKIVLDTSGSAFVSCLKFKPWFVKPNKSELEAILGRVLTDEAEVISAAMQIREMGAQNVMVSLGGDGAVLVDSEGKAYARKAFDIKAKNTVGAGDSAVAGYIVGYEKGSEYALKLACAAGAATAANDGLAKREDILKLL